MASIQSLSSTERAFFANVAKAAFSNPFSDERVELDLRLASMAEDQSDRVRRAAGAVTGWVQRLEAEGRADVRLYRGEDREMLLIAFLFDAFHRFLQPLDRLILDQDRQGDHPIHVPFARDVMGLLERRGFSTEGIRHFVAVFYQLRRAYFFIDRGLTGRSASMKALRRRLWNNVFTSDIRWYERFLWDRMEDFSTLLLGETGTGKGAAAAAIGRSGYIPFDDRKGAFAESFTRSFISIHLAQYPATLIESELFGHRKGAFTGAMEDHQGILARCSPHGAIFLDEIGDVSVPVQIKLLQVLQERTFSPVGSHERLRFRGRVVAATNRPVEDLRRRGEFREDFFYRLCSDVIQVPPLRQRMEEDPGELDLLLAQLVARMVGDEAPDLATEIAERLRRQPGPAYGWPGNVRELEQAARQILLNQRYETGTPTGPTDPEAALVDGIQRGTLDADALLSAYCALLHRRLGTYEAVADRIRLDRRTVKKYVKDAAT